MSHKARARNARPYGHGGVMCSSFFRDIVGARIARPLLEFVQNFGFAHLLKEYAANAPRLKVGFIIAYLEWVSKHARFMTKSEENLKKVLTADLKFAIIVFVSDTSSLGNCVTAAPTTLTRIV